MKPPRIQISAKVLIVRPSYNEGSYNYSERIVPEAREEYHLAFDGEDREALVSQLIGLLTAIRGEAR